MINQLLYFSSIIILQINILLPIEVKNRRDITKLHLTEIGSFGIQRVPKNNNAAHFHTGIDIKRPNKNYNNEPVYPLADGKVISIRDDGAYAEIIIENKINNTTIWTLYEHISGILVHVNEIVNIQKPIARFMNKDELDRLGWQFDHFHLEVLKIKPELLKPDKAHPERYYKSYTLKCITNSDLQKYYYNPFDFIKNNLNPGKSN